MGWHFNSDCYTDGGKLLEAAKGALTSVTSTGSVYWQNGSFNGGTGRLDYTVFARPFSGTGGSTIASYMMLPACTPTGELTLTDVFALPSQSDAEAAWAVGFSIPFALALLAWGIRKVLDMF